MLSLRGISPSFAFRVRRIRANALSSYSFGSIFSRGKYLYKWKVSLAVGSIITDGMYNLLLEVSLPLGGSISCDLFYYMLILNLTTSHKNHPLLATV